MQLQWRSLVRRAWTFADVRLTQPQVNLLIAQDGRFNVAELVETVTKRWPDPGSNRSPPPRVSIGLFTLERGRCSSRTGAPVTPTCWRLSISR